MVSLIHNLQVKHSPIHTGQSNSQFINGTLTDPHLSARHVKVELEAGLGDGLKCHNLQAEEKWAQQHIRQY